jgi:hypothetical protein
VLGGRAVALAAIDWARCGRTDTISEETLRQLWPIYLRDRGWIPRDVATFAAGVDWALRPVAGRIALLQSDDGYQAYDYAVRLAADTPNTEAPPTRSGLLRLALLLTLKRASSQTVPVDTVAMRMRLLRTRAHGSRQTPKPLR